MIQTYDTDAILYGILKGSTAVTGAINGGIYAGQRPDNSVKQDIVVNTIALTQEYEPQLGASNVNIHVPDIDIKAGNVTMKVEDRAKLKAIAGHVLTALRAAKIQGLTLTVASQNTIREAEIQQHFVNIRIDWSIH